MCGIVGLYHLDQRQINSKILDEMKEALYHRGPDDGHLFVYQNIGLAHRRLSILDTSDAGAQPMMSKNRQWIIVFNGCIYNFPELKKELITLGHKFSSTSDTEVIVEGISRFGIDYIKRFNGMFAIAALNINSKKLFLCRDRHGVKPLYYFFDGKNFAFASEIKAFLKLDFFNVELNKSVLNEYFTFQNVFRYQTLFQNVNMLPPANIIEITSETKNIIHKSWWDYKFVTNHNLTFNEAKEETKRLMVQAVKRQLVSDVPIGAYLSGGMDSGSITSIASSSIHRISTFTAGFDMSSVTGIESNYDERRDAEIMASIFKTEHYEQVIGSSDLPWSLPRVVWHLEDLRVGMSYPNYYISRLASKFVKVCLQGTGGDELFGGYPWRYYRIFRSLDQNDYFENYYNFWQRLVPDEQKHNLFNFIYDPNEPKEIFKRVFTFNKSLNYNSPEEHINNSLYFEIKTFLSALLLIGDKLSMANSLEERFPFLDNDLVDFAMAIPVKYKLGRLDYMKKLDENEYQNKHKAYSEYDDGKNILRQAMTDFLPKVIIDRKKQGFSAPDENWYRNENANYLKKLLLDKRKSLSHEFINRDFIKTILDEHNDHKCNHRLLIWGFSNFEWWCRLFLDGQRI
jgi:asparagine synthase (glutamine-hydrolysing)